MPRIEGPTRSMAPLMVCIAGALLLSRLSLYVYEHYHPPVATEEIQWKSAESLVPLADLNARPYLLWFTAAWCGPCKLQEQSSFCNKEIVHLINQNFIPVRITDRKKEDGKNRPKVQASEGRYRIFAFPTLVTALPDSDYTEIEQQAGFLSNESTVSFLQQSLKDLNFEKGIQLLVQNKHKESASLMSQWLQNGASWQSTESVNGALYLSVAYLFMKDEAKARAVLTDARAKAKIKDWPLPLLDYLDKSPEKLIESAEDDPYQLSCAHYFAAAQLLFLKADTAGALTHLNWINEHGTAYKKLTKAMLEYIHQG